MRRSSRQMKFMAAPGRFVRSEMKETRETRIETGGRTTRDLQKNIKKVQRLVTIRSFFFFFSSCRRFFMWTCRLFRHGGRLLSIRRRRRVRAARATQNSQEHVEN